MFERFTDKARRALVLGQEEARLLGHNFIGTEHILLGILRVEDSMAAAIMVEAGLDLDSVRAATVERVGATDQDAPALDADALRAIGIDLEEVVRSAEEAFGVGALEGTEAAVRDIFRGRRRRRRRSLTPAFTPAAKALLGNSLREALQLGHNYIGTEHLLLAAARPTSGLASQILGDRLTLDRIREETRQRLRDLRR